MFANLRTFFYVIRIKTPHRPFQTRQWGDGVVLFNLTFGLLLRRLLIELAPIERVPGIVFNFFNFLNFFNS